MLRASPRSRLSDSSSFSDAVRIGISWRGNGTRRRKYRSPIAPPLLRIPRATLSFLGGETRGAIVSTLYSAEAIKHQPALRLPRRLGRNGADFMGQENK